MDHGTGHIGSYFGLPWLLKSKDLLDILQVELLE